MQTHAVGKVFATLLLATACGQAFVLPGSSEIVDDGEAEFPGRGPDGEDDMILTAEQMEDFLGLTPETSRNGQKDLKYRWPKGQVFYEMDPTFTSDERGVVYQAIYHIHQKSCILFLPKRVNTRDYVKLTKNKSGCYAQVGRVGGAQRLNLGPGCSQKYVVIHELVHAIGFWHEQSRSDRDDWVQINWANILEDKRHNFNKLSPDVIDPFGRGYDYKSLMHYGGYDFALDRAVPTIIPKKPQVQPRQLGNREGLTPWDADKIDNMYKGICQYIDAPKNSLEGNEREFVGWWF